MKCETGRTTDILLGRQVVDVGIHTAVDVRYQFQPRSDPVKLPDCNGDSRYTVKGVKQQSGSPTQEKYYHYGHQHLNYL